jgi:hypothetical protein
MHLRVSASSESYKPMFLAVLTKLVEKNGCLVVVYEMTDLQMAAAKNEQLQVSQCYKADKHRQQVT